MPALQMRVMQAAHDAPALASSVNIGAFNLGNAIGAAFGGIDLSGRNPQCRSVRRNLAGFRGAASGPYRGRHGRWSDLRSIWVETGHLARLRLCCDDARCLLEMTPVSCTSLVRQAHRRLGCSGRLACRNMRHQDKTPLPSQLRDLKEKRL